MHHISKHRIVPLFNERDPIATEWVCSHYLAPVYVIVRRLTKNSPETDDLVQKTFIAVLKHKEPFESLRKIEYFLYTTAKNVSMDRMRHRLRVIENSEKAVAYYMSLPNEEDAVKAAEQAAAFQHLIQLANEILPKRCKEVFNLCYIEGLKNAAISLKLGNKVKTVANLKLKAYKILREAIIAGKHPDLMDFLGLLLL